MGFGVGVQVWVVFFGQDVEAFLEVRGGDGRGYTEDIVVGGLSFLAEGMICCERTPSSKAGVDAWLGRDVSNALEATVKGGGRAQAQKHPSCLNVESKSLE